MKRYRNTGKIAGFRIGPDNETIWLVDRPTMEDETVTDRTEEQAAANEFDAALYRLIVIAERNAGKKGQEGWRWVAWKDAADMLLHARPHVRRLMHLDDRIETLDEKTRR